MPRKTTSASGTAGRLARLEARVRAVRNRRVPTVAVVTVYADDEQAVAEQYADEQRAELVVVVQKLAGRPARESAPRR